MSKDGDRGAAVLVVVFLVVMLLAPVPLLAHWERPEDNQPVAVLEGMSNEQLFNEALDVCVARALCEGSTPASDPSAAPTLFAASLYLENIARVAADKNGGTVPPWIDTLLSAHTGKQCQRGLHSFLEAGAPRAARTAHPRPRRRTRLNQLPPWLAPR